VKCASKRRARAEHIRNQAGSGKRHRNVNKGHKYNRREKRRRKEAKREREKERGGETRWKEDRRKRKRGGEKGETDNRKKGRRRRRGRQQKTANIRCMEKDTMAEGRAQTDSACCQGRKANDLERAVNWDREQREGDALKDKSNEEE
jgi:hypothetical protein